MTSQFHRSFPRVMRIEPAAACNLRCSHCPTGTVSMKRGLMAPELFEKLLGEIEQHRDEVKVVVLYHGGEPLMNKRFTEMIVRVKALGVPYVKTVSNGMLLTDEVASDIIASGLDAITFSLDAESPDQSNFVRRNSNYDTTVKNIKALISKKAQLGASTPKIYISSTQFIQSPAALESRASAPEYLLREFSGVFADSVDYNVNYAMRWPHMEVDEDLYELYLDPNSPHATECDHVDNTITIRASGEVVPCCYDLTSQLVMGNVMQDSLAQIWNSPAYLELRRQIHCGTPGPSAAIAIPSCPRYIWFQRLALRCAPRRLRDATSARAEGAQGRPRSTPCGMPSARRARSGSTPGRLPFRFVIL